MQEGTVKVEFDEKGHEIPDPKPMEAPVSFTRPPTIREMIQRMVKYEISMEAEQAGNESFAEADDFDTGEDVELRSPYQLDDEQEQRSLSEFIEEKPLEKPDPQPPAEPPAKKPDDKAAPPEPANEA